MAKNGKKHTRREKVHEKENGQKFVNNKKGKKTHTRTNDSRSNLAHRLSDGNHTLLHGAD
jgi:hypothetical protein